MFLRDDGRPPLPAQFSLRVAVIGAFALVMFAIIFFRLWYLQVLSGDKYLAQAQNQRVRDFTVLAPRGEITDRHGNVLVGNRTALALQIHTEELPKRASVRRHEFADLASKTGLTPAQIASQIRKQTKLAPASPVTLSRDVPYDLVYYIRENQDQFPGVSVDRVYVRQYPEGTLAAHVLGYVREASADQLKEPRFQNADPGDQVGQDGVEDTYDSVLRGINGDTRVTVDASGRPTGGTLSQRQPQAGDNLVLTLDSAVQRAGEQAIGSFGAPGAAFAVMNIHSGEVLGLGSSPTFDPSVFAKPDVSQAETQAIFGNPDSVVPGPIIDRATTGAYPTGSTFKPITALAALQTQEITPSTIFNDTGSLTLAPGQTVHNAGGAVNGPINLEQALKVSSDVFFFHLGAELDSNPSEPIQSWAENLGLGSPTGIDLPGERAGLVPSRDWRNAGYRRDTAPNSPGGAEVLLSKGETFDRMWSAGDDANLAVGQGDLQADPLQMAVAYAALANGGDVERPHVGLRVEDGNGRVIQQIDPGPRRHVDIDPVWQRTILTGLHAAAQEVGGTSYSVFGSYPVGVAGKTGTAETTSGVDQSWYVVLAPYPNPQIVCAVTVEQGGFGVDSAAPAAKQILNSYFNFQGKKAAQAASTPGSTAGAFE